ncbi:hypothetical protein [uncultured Legionella sp.]|nr:hypothetical protein [uncultured Legionella sp.]
MPTNIPDLVDPLSMNKKKNEPEVPELKKENKNLRTKVAQVKRPKSL